MTGSDKFVSFRRYYLDEWLERTNFGGRVLDVGGERRPRGRFQPPRGAEQGWVILNPDSTNEPDVVGSADVLPFKDGEFDIVKVTEVLEHLVEPVRALEECLRVLRPGGRLVLSVPFLFGVHGDPQDYLRWTESGLRRLLEAAGFVESEVHAMGGLVAVMADLFEYQCHLVVQEKKRLPLPMKVVRFLVRRLLLNLMLRVDGSMRSRAHMNTGYFAVARRP